MFVKQIVFVVCVLSGGVCFGQQDSGSFLNFLNQNNTAFRRVQSQIAQRSSASFQARQRGTLSPYSTLSGGYNGFQQSRRGVENERQQMINSINRFRSSGSTRVSHLRTLPRNPMQSRNSGFTTGHQSGFMYTSRFYGSGPR